jgi:hypothetical protein
LAGRLSLWYRLSVDVSDERKLAVRSGLLRSQENLRLVPAPTTTARSRGRVLLHVRKGSQITCQGLSPSDTARRSFRQVPSSERR